MLMLTSYMDETGHSRDEKSKFNGMGGLMCKVEEWDLFERRWQKILDRFKIPYIHMNESVEMFDGWPETKIHALSKTVWDAVEKIRPLPIGSIIPMDEFRRAEERFRYYFEDPYFLTMQDCMKLAFTPAFVFGLAREDVKVAMVFSDQVEFRHEALSMYETIRNTTPIEWRGKIDPPDFRNMRDWGALQAADMVTFEIYKEADRVYYNRARKQRYGYGRILEIFKRANVNPAIRYHDGASLARILHVADRNTRLETYWEKKRAKQSKDTTN